MSHRGNPEDGSETPFIGDFQVGGFSIGYTETSSVYQCTTCAAVLADPELRELYEHRKTCQKGERK